MSSKAHADRLARAIEGTELAQAVQTGFTENRINVLCRVGQGAEKQWMELIHRMLLATDAEAGKAHAWQAHICRHYFLKQVGDERKLVFGWNISIQSQDMSTSLDFLIGVVKGEAPGARSASRAGELEEFPLVGATGDRNRSTVPGQRGAFAIEGKESFRPPVRR